MAALFSRTYISTDHSSPDAYPDWLYPQNASRMVEEYYPDNLFQIIAVNRGVKAIQREG